MRWVLLGLLCLSACRPAPRAEPSPEAAVTAPPPPSAKATVSAPSSAASAPALASATTAPAPRAHVACPKRKRTSPPYARLEDVDWCEATVVPGFAVLHDGVAKVHDHFDDGGQVHVYRLGHVSYGDVGGDGVAEAVVVFDEPSAGAHGRVTVFRLQGGNAEIVDVQGIDGVVETKVVGKAIELTVRRGAKACVARGALAGGHLGIGPCT